MKVLVTGGCGYIVSHTVVELIENGYDVIVVDNLVNSKIEVLDNIYKITNVRPKFYQIDLCDEEKLEEVFKENAIDSVIHFAGLKAVGESVKKPLKYYSNNLVSTINLLSLMKKYKVNNLIFSSSATVYGDQKIPYVESMGRGKTTNPYGTTKAMIEKIIEDECKANPDFNSVILRYFNPVGSHESGLLGESPNGIPNNLMPYVMQVASGKRDHLSIFGNDYPTRDGTGVRDYIHVVDLAKGHVKSIEYMEKHKGLNTFNLGTEKGYSVLDIVNTFERVNNVKIKYEIVGRRDGDLPEYYANAAKAKTELGWTAEKSLEDMCRDAWNFEKNNFNHEL